MTKLRSITELRSAFYSALHRAEVLLGLWSSPKRVASSVLHLGPKRTDRLALFAHYDQDGRIDAYVFEYLHELRRCGFDTVLVSTSETLDPSDVERARASCRAVISRANLGIDFGSWKCGLETLPDWASYTQLLLANDSVFGPLFPLSTTFEAAQRLQSHVVGLTDNHAFRTHLQSYFLIFDLRHEPCVRFVADYFRRVRLVRNKHWAVRAYEIPLAAMARRHGLTCKVLFPAADRPEWATDPLMNPTHAAWDSLILDAQFPFLKRDLLIRNPRNIPGTESWPEVVHRSGSTYDCELIEAYLRRTLSSGRCAT